MSKKGFEEIVLDKLSNIETRVWNIETDVSWLKTDVSWLKTDVSWLKTDVSWLKTDVSWLKTDIKNLDTKVTIIEERSMMTDRKIDWLYDKIEDLEWAIELNRKYINQSFSNSSISI